MARKPQVRYYPSRGAYYTQLGGRQHLLATGPDDGPGGPTFQLAAQAFSDLLRLSGAEEAGDENTVRVVLELYLQHIESRRKPATLRMRQQAFRAVCQLYGEKPVSQLTHADIYRLCDSRKKARPNPKTGKLVGAGSAADALKIIDGLSGAFSWAVKVGHITKNPLAGIERPQMRSRGRDCIVDEKSHEEILKIAPKDIRRLIVCLENCGCRPGELIAASAVNWNDDLGCLYYPKDSTRQADEFGHKNSRKKDRFIFFSGEALLLVRSLVSKHPSGPLFRNRRGRGFSEKTVVHHFGNFRRKLSMPKLTAMSYRHTFATRHLQAGMPIDTLASLMGNSPEVIRKHYSHILDGQWLRKQVEQFRQAAQAEAPAVLPFPGQAQ